MAPMPSPSSSSSLAPARLPRQRRRRYSRRPAPCRGPSVALLSTLATIVTTSCPTRANPISPLHFLCPFAGRQNKPLSPTAPQHRGRSYSPRDLSSNSETFKRQPRSVPVRYDQGEDGVYRRVDEYTLYGSTVCKDCPTSPLPTLPPMPAGTGEDKLAPTTSYTPLSASPTGDILDTLPLGWKPNVKSGIRTTVILTLSLILAFVISLLMIGCIIWRRKKRRMAREDIDVEKKARLRLLASEEERAAEKEARASLKFWARASAQWKARARYSAHRRRGNNRLAGRPQAHSSSISFRDTARVPSETSSNHLSRRPSVSSVSASDGRTSPHISVSSPPAYGIDRASHSGLSLLPLPPPDFLRSFSRHSTAALLHDGVDVGRLAHSTSICHVATDDKRLLDHLASMASAPPGVGDGSALAPDWPDEDPGDFLEELVPEVPTPLDTSFTLPPPSQKVAEYELSLADFAEPGPSAPPFEIACGGSPSCPGLLELIPSAPPVLDDDDEFPESSAPELTDFEPSERSNSSRTSTGLGGSTLPSYP